MGADAIVNSTMGFCKNDLPDHFPHKSNAEYMIDIGIYANFLEKDKKSAIEAARLSMLFSRQMQKDFGAKVYRHGWEWDKKIYKELFS
jgi:hypothetical protein